MPKSENIWIQKFEATGLQIDQNMAMLDVEAMPLPPDFKTQLPARIIRLMPEGWSGDHKHLTRQVYVALNEGAYLTWRDSEGQVHEAKMMEPDKFIMFGIPPYMPHLVENRSEEPVVLYELLEFRDGPIEKLVGVESLRKTKPI